MNKEFLYVVAMISVALQTTAISTEYWGTLSASKAGITVPSQMHGEASMGLWKVCGEIWGNPSGVGKVDADVCLHLPPEGAKNFPKNSLYAARVFSLLGLSFVVLAILSMLTMPAKPLHHAVLFFLGGVCSLIANIVWAAELLHIKVSDSQDKLKFSPGFSFYLNLGGSFTCLAGGILSLVKL
jgi:hypothetical protein